MDEKNNLRRDTLVCPKCGKFPQLMQIIRDGASDGFAYQCTQCQLGAPSAYSPAEAEKEWRELPHGYNFWITSVVKRDMSRARMPKDICHERGSQNKNDTNKHIKYFRKTR